MRVSAPGVEHAGHASGVLKCASRLPKRILWFRLGFPSLPAVWQTTRPKCKLSLTGVKHAMMVIATRCPHHPRHTWQQPTRQCHAGLFAVGGGNSVLPSSELPASIQHCQLLRVQHTPPLWGYIATHERACSFLQILPLRTGIHVWLGLRTRDPNPSNLAHNVPVLF